MDTSDTAQTIADNAFAPKRFTSDSTTAEQHPIADQILAEEYRAKKAAAKKAHRGIRMTRIVPPGAV